MSLKLTFNNVQCSTRRAACDACSCLHYTTYGHGLLRSGASGRVSGVGCRVSGGESGGYASLSRQVVDMFNGKVSALIK